MKRWLMHDPYPQITAVIENLNYDFRQFELDHFLAHVSHLRGREIRYRGFPFSPTLFGLWIPVGDRDYLAYNSGTYHVHHVHILLHEVGHLLLGHQPIPLERLFGNEAEGVIRVLEGQPSVPLNCLPRAQAATLLEVTPQEKEAEAFSTLIQQRVIRAHRFQYLLNTSTTIDGLKVFTDALGFQE